MPSTGARAPSRWCVASTGLDRVFADFVDWSLIDVLGGKPGAPSLGRVIPRGRMGLAYCDVVALQTEPPTLSLEEVGEVVKRREALVIAASLLFGGAVFGETAG